MKKKENNFIRIFLWKNFMQFLRIKKKKKENIVNKKNF
jgi:hypothetical protein